MLEIAGVVVLGIAAQWIAWRTRIPAILPLILTGLLVGPIADYFIGFKIIDPLFSEIDPHSDEGHFFHEKSYRGLFAGETLFYFVSLAIGIILFEGGLTLNRKEFKGVGSSIIKLISLGSAVTFFGAGIATHYIMGLNWTISFLFAGLIIVTGPTVIAPILRNVPLTRNTATILKWEGILIDPVGALVAVLVYNFITSGENGQEFTIHAITSFFKILIIGTALGFSAAYGLYIAIKNHWIPHYLLNVVTLALVMGVFVLSDELAHESGLLTVVVMGMALGNLNVPHLKEILYFKESLSVLLIAALFILLSANMEMEQLLLLGGSAALLFAVVVFILRPLAVFLSTIGSELSTNEKLFISWVGPRGIVAAGIASLFGIKLTQEGYPGAEMITPLVFMIVLGTVLLNATTARMIAGMLGVTMEKSDGILIIGAHKAARLMAKYLQDNNRHVVVLDSSEEKIKQAQAEGLEVIQSSVYSEDLEENYELLDMGYLLAMTGSNDVNQFACDKFGDTFGENGTYRLISSTELASKADTSELSIISKQDDYINFQEAARDHPEVHEYHVESAEQFEEVMQILNKHRKSVPFLVKGSNGLMEIVGDNFDVETVLAEGGEVVYIGKKIETVA